MAGHYNPTQLMGLASFGAAAVACGWAAMRRPALRRGGWFAASAFAVLAVEVLLGWRHRLSGFVAGALPAGDYALRRPWQAAIILVLVIAGAVAIGRLVRRRSAMETAAGAALMLFAVETVSLHAVDGVFYRPVGPVLLIGWLWLVLAVAAVVAALRAARGR